MADNQKLTEDEKVLHGMGYAQELARRMGGFSNFAISSELKPFVSVCTADISPLREAWYRICGST